MRTLRFILVAGILLSVCAPVFGDFPVRQSNSSDITPVVAYNSVNNEYLVVWNEMVPLGSGLYLIGPVVGQRLSGTGSLLGSTFTIFMNGVDPSVAYHSVNNEYLVTATWNGIQGKHVSSSGVVDVNSVQLMTGVGYSRILYNSLAQNYLLIGVDYYENPANSGYFSAKFYSRRIGADGSLLAASALVETVDLGYQPGEPIYAVAYAPIQSTETPTGRYLMAFGGPTLLHMLDSNGETIIVVYDAQHGNIPFSAYIPLKTGDPGGGEFNVGVAYGAVGGDGITVSMVRRSWSFGAIITTSSIVAAIMASGQVSMALSSMLPS